LDKSYVFDTSAIFAYIEDERGGDIVENILKLAKRGKARVYISFISLMELYYVTWQRKGEDIAKETIVLIKSLPLEVIESSERLILSAGRIKANHKLSVADAIIAATALEKSAGLVHKDLELKPVSQYVTTLELPF
jgi:predicted nucleic acid-binding protein